jgi:atypical dual specificity phosphatase
VEPHVFDWLLPDQLGVCVNPSVSKTAATELEVRGIGLLINLHEVEDPSDLLGRLNATSIHMPVLSNDPPTQAQLDHGVEAIRDAIQRGTRVVVHCGAGLGRSGTLLAAYLVREGSPPDVAIEDVRRARPGAIETLEQERAVHAFAQRHAPAT